MKEQENASEITDYSKDIEDIFISFMISNPDLFVRCKGIMKSEYFDDRQNKDTIAFIESYSIDFSIIPSLDEIYAVTQKEIRIMDKEAVIHDAWFLREFEKFCRHKALRDAILSSPNKLDEGKYGEVLANIKAAVEVALVKDLGLDYYADPKSRLESLKENKGQVSTGWKTVDEKLYGGLNKGEITIFAGQSGSGKSIFLQNLGVNWAMAGFNVVYLSLELSEKLCAMRIDAMHTGYETREVMRNIDDSHMKIRAMHQKSKGSLRIKQLPNGCTTNDIRAFIKEYEIHCGKKVDAILVDYLDLMSPMSRKISAENMFVKDKYVTEELRNLAVELDIVTVSASQLNRCLSPDTKVNIENKGIIEIKDVVVGDKILSASGYNLVKDKWHNKSNHVYRVTTESGKQIICSANHRFPTKSGIDTIESGLSIGDILFVKNK
jgi:KaiC/GvpD/RAD55 family RecA-like ATPase